MERKGKKMTCKEFIPFLEVMAPKKYAAGWDNVGLLLGREDKEIHKIMIAVDATDAVIDQAIRAGVDLLLTHHPMIFKPLNRICSNHFIGKRALNLLQEDICYYAMHTNFDVMGMADCAAEKIHLQNSQVLEVTFEDVKEKEGYGRYGQLPREMSLLECANMVKDAFGLENVIVYGEPERRLETAAISPGSVKSVVSFAVNAGVDVLISGDVDHHTGIDLLEQGVAVIDAGHYGLEYIFVEYMKKYIESKLPSMIIETEVKKCPYYIV